MSTISSINKTLKIGTIRLYENSPYATVYVTLRYGFSSNNTTHKTLSITGVEGPDFSGNCTGGCGQITLNADSFQTLETGWTKPMIATLAEIWERWHLNTMKAGTPEQNSAIRDFLSSRSYPNNDYTHQCNYLESLGLLTVKHPISGEPYKYGTQWLEEPVPEDVLIFLNSLPESTAPAPWKDRGFYKATR